MKLLDAVLPRVKRLLPDIDRGTALAVFGFLAALEVVGRYATTDVHDLVGGATLVLGTMFLAAWHRSQPVAWIARMGDYARRQASKFEQLKYDIGVDFRTTPAFPRRVPHTVVGLFLGLIAWTGLAQLVWAAFPDGWRGLGLQTTYVGYLVVMVGLWGLLLVGVGVGVYLPVLVFDRQMRSLTTAPPTFGPPPAHTSPDAVVLLGYFLTAVLVSSVTPPIYGLGFCLVATIVGLSGWGLSPPGDAALLWRGGRRGAVYSLPLSRILGLLTAFVGLVFIALIVSASGGRLFAAPAFDTPTLVTGFLGSLAAWLVPGLVFVGLFELVRFHRENPGRRQPTSVCLLGVATPTDRQTAARHIRGWGLPVRTEADPDAVGIRLVPSALSEAKEFDPRWPLNVSVDDLAEGAVKDRITRRDEIRLRRRFMKGLAKLVKQSTAAVPESGGGLWIAPHWWFVDTLLWEAPNRDKSDDEGDTLRPIGPSYSRLFGRRVRQHWHQVLRATQIDLIYLEHGVGHRKLEKVLRSILELYDIHGGKRPAADHHFRGVPRVRVMIHDYTPGNPFQQDGYPQPKFDDISRFRVLHVFKDRGEDEELSDAPFDFSWEPMPMTID